MTEESPRYSFQETVGSLSAEINKAPLVTLEMAQNLLSAHYRYRSSNPWKFGKNLATEIAYLKQNVDEFQADLPSALLTLIQIADHFTAFEQDTETVDALIKCIYTVASSRLTPEPNSVAYGLILDNKNYAVAASRSGKLIRTFAAAVDYNVSLFAPEVAHSNSPSELLRENFDQALAELTKPRSNLN